MKKFAIGLVAGVMGFAGLGWGVGSIGTVVVVVVVVVGVGVGVVVGVTVREPGDPIPSSAVGTR